jgi:hypothetical protein
MSMFGKVTFASGSLIPCQNRKDKNDFVCLETVRIYKTLCLNDASEFRCADCLNIPGYTHCIRCFGMCKTDNLFCFVCEKNDAKSVPTAKPSSCQCCKDNTDIKWTYNPFDADVNDTYVYGWWCDECLDNFRMDI